MRTYAILQLTFAIPLAFLCATGFSRIHPQVAEAFLPISICMIAVAATAGVGLLFRSDLCAYLALLTNLVFFAGCVVLFWQSLVDFGQPLPVRQYNTDDGPELASLARSGAVLISLLALLASTSLLLCVGGVFRSFVSRRVQVRQ